MQLEIRQLKLLILLSLTLLFMPAVHSEGEQKITERGTVPSLKISGLNITYLSGKNADAQTPVFNMSVGEITVENTKNHPLSLRYNPEETFFTGHRFEFGTLIKKVYVDPPLHPVMAESNNLITFNLPPGGKIHLSRRDLMALFQQLGRQYFLDGRVCTRFESTIWIETQAYPLKFGPPCFTVDLERDWETEEKLYLQFFLNRDKAR